MSVPVKRDCIEYLNTLTLSQWKDKHNAYGFLKSIFANFQSTEDTFFDILEKRSLATSEGVQLDIIGELFNIKRDGRVDESYRQAIYEKISQQAYGVTIPNIVEVLRTAASAEKVEVYEHPHGNVHVYLDVGPQQNLSSINSSITAAGISSNTMFLPLNEIYAGVDSGLAYHHSSSDNSITSPYQFNVVGWNINQTTVINDTTIAPNNTLSADTIIDDSVAQSERVSWSGDISPGQEFDASLFVKKDSSSSNYVLLEVRLSGGVVDKYYAIQVALASGESGVFLPSSLYSNPISYYVEDCIDYWFITLRAASLDHTQWEYSIYPSSSTVLGSLDPSLTGSIVVWGASLYLDTYQYKVSISDGCLRLPMIIREEYLVIDDIGDFVVDENIDNILAISEGVYNPSSSKPLSVYHNIANNQPISVVV